MYSATCQSCGAEFEARRFGTKTCSDKCRKRLSRNGSRVPEGPALPGPTPLDVIMAKRNGTPLPTGAEADPGRVTVTEALAQSDRVAEVKALRATVAAALDNDRTPPSAIAPLTRTMLELGTTLDALLAVADVFGEGVVNTPDEPFDYNDI